MSSVARVPGEADTTDILIIDDEAAIRDLLVAAVRQMGHSVLTAKDGAAAQELLARVRFRLIVTDIFMPNMDGYEVMMLARTAQPSVPILAMTGGGISGGPESTLVPARHLGSRRTLAKPFELADFFAITNEMLGPTPPKITSERS